MKRLIAALVTATVIPLASCTNAAMTAPSGDPTSSGAVSTTTSSPPPTPADTTVSTSASPSSPPPPPASTATSTTTSSGDVYDAIPVDIPATITGADLDAAKQGVAVWRNAVRVLDESLQDPGGKDWKPVIYRYINDPAAIKQLALINTFVKQDIHQVGDTGYTAKVFEANDHSIKIRACVDLSNVDYLDADGNSQLLSSDRHAKWEFWLSLYAEPKDVWFVGLIDKPKPVQPCAP